MGLSFLVRSSVRSSVYSPQALVLRIPVVPGVNDTSGDHTEFLKIAGDLAVEFPPCTHAAAFKYRMIECDYLLEELTIFNPANCALKNS